VLRLTVLPTLAGTAGLLLSCTDGPAPPSAPEPLTGSLAVEASTSGTDIGQDGYQLFLDGSYVRSIGPNDAIQRSGVPAGRHLVKISGVLPNCWMVGPRELEVTIPASGIAEARFEVACTTPNTFLVTTRTAATGRPAPDSLPATISYFNGQLVCSNYLSCIEFPIAWQQIQVPANGVFQRSVNAQKVMVALSIPQDCRALSGNTQKVATRPNGVVRFTFEITCN
jgi:hypothetical protein